MPSDERRPGPASGSDPETHTVSTGASVSERRIGPYRIVRELGQGGMGTVYLASRADEQFRKRVALKVIRSGADSAEVIRHFKRERQILAGLDHPNIARLLDGGATAEGLPYLVMEYIEGEQILRYCDSRSIPVSGRLKLFQAVCSAVQYAHRNLVVHRDIKPGNVLVGEDGAPRLLDFGIAKLLNPGLAGEAPTATSVAMTPAYASPEQVRGGRITTASDVYSLGVMLYELLTGRLPYRLASHQPLDVLRAVSEQEPEKPSTAVGRRGGEASTLLERTQAGAEPTGPGAVSSEDLPLEPTAESVARAREGTPERLARRLRGDLDNILMMALSKDLHARYASVEAFADDVQRYLDGLPVVARKPTLGYRAGKFVRRHLLGVAASVAVATLLVAFAVAMAVQSERVARERDLARKERETAQRVSGFLVDLFKVSDPGEARGNSVTAREVLDLGTAKIATELQDQPEVRATLMDTMGTVHRNLGLYDKAIALLREALATRRKALGEEHLDVAQSLNNLAIALHVKGDYHGAESLHRESLALRRRLLGDEHPDVAKSLNNVANALIAHGDSEGAEVLYREALTLKRKLLGRAHPSLADGLNNLAILLFERGDYHGAEGLYREALAMRRELVGGQHPAVAELLSNLAVLRYRQGDYAGAESLHRESLALLRQSLGDDHPYVAFAMAGLAETLCRQQKPDEAEPLARAALVTVRKTFASGHANIAEAEGMLGGCLTLSRQYAQAEALLLASSPVIKAKKGDRSWDYRQVLERIVRLYESWGKPDEAARYRALLQQASTPER